MANQSVDPCVLIAHVSALQDIDPDGSLNETWRKLKSQTIVSGVNQPDDRARLLSDGFGDAVDDNITSGELEARAKRLAAVSRLLPPQRIVGPLIIDLLSRDAYVEGKAVGLFPLEFAMLWRLAETPDECVSMQALANAIWPAGHKPSANTKAVQLSRLRAKLKASGLPKMIETIAGGYRLRSVPAPA